VKHTGRGAFVSFFKLYYKRFEHLPINQVIVMTIRTLKVLIHLQYLIPYTMYKYLSTASRPTEYIEEIVLVTIIPAI